jgi:tetratricopeptide (TPR) repeat protein
LSQIDPKYLDAAIASLKTAETLAPTDPKLTYHLGLVELTKGDTASALGDLEKSVSLKPNYLSAWFDLGKAYDLAKQPEKARQTYEFILRYLAPENPEVTAELNALNLQNLPK